MNIRSLIFLSLGTSQCCQQVNAAILFSVVDSFILVHSAEIKGARSSLFIVEIKHKLRDHREQGESQCDCDSINVPHSLRHLNIWSTVGGTVGDWGGVALLK